MSGWRRTLAALRLSIVFGLVSGIGATLVFTLIRLVTGVPTDPHFLQRLFVPWFLMGMGMGLVFTTVLAIAGQRSTRSRLGAGRGAMLGLFGGVVVTLVLRFLLMPAVFGPGDLVATLLVPSTVFGVVGAGIGSAMLGIARRGTLPAGADDPELLPPR